jgi:hypothetical protein
LKRKKCATGREKYIQLLNKRERISKRRRKKKHQGASVRKENFLCWQIDDQQSSRIIKIQNEEGDFISQYRVNFNVSECLLKIVEIL